MKKMKSPLNHKGTILQIVLVIFMVLVLNINLVFFNVIENSRSIKRIEEVNQNRLLELTIIRYYKETILNDILFSDEVECGDYLIRYTVDDFDKSYYIVTTILKNDIEYSFNLEIDKETLIISKLDYQ